MPVGFITLLLLKVTSQSNPKVDSKLQNASNIEVIDFIIRDDNFTNQQDLNTIRTMLSK